MVNLNSEESQARLSKLVQWRRQARVAQADNRTEMATDEDFYDGIQLTPEDVQVLLERKQPPLVFNVVKSTINWILGTERKARIDFNILPRQKEGATAAKAKTKVMKYIQDVSDGEYEASAAFTEAVCAGLGWLEFGVRARQDTEPIYTRHEPWRNMWFDHLGTDLGGRDMRFVIREKWVDLDIAIGMFPDREGELRTVAQGVNSLYPYVPDDSSIIDTASEFDLESDLDSLFGGPGDGTRERLKMIEMWYRMPANVKLLKMRDDDTPYGTLNGAIYRPNQADHKYLVKGGYASTYDAHIMTVRCAIWTGSTFLQDELSPYNHNRFPFIPIFCYKRKRDNMPYGVIRDLRDPQADLNRRRSRALVLLTANRIMYEKGAFDDPVKAYSEFQRADMMLEVNKDFIAANRIKPIDNSQLANQHVILAEQDEDFIHTTSGVTYENQGTTKRELSGKAITALQNQGAQSNGVVFDNYWYSRKLSGEILLSLVEQFMDSERQLRISGAKEKTEFLDINKREEDGSVTNDITRNKDDFVIAKQDYRETMRLSMLQTLNEIIQSLAQTMPDMAMNLLDLMFEYMDDLPNKEEIIARIRKINKQGPPDDEISPEERQKKQQQEQAMAQEAAELKQIQKQMMVLELRLKEAEVGEKAGKAYKEKIDAQVKKIEGMVKALEVAVTLAQSPQIAKGADAIIDDSKKIEVDSNKGTTTPEEGQPPPQPIGG